HLEEPGLEVGLMFRKVRDAVLKATGNKQEPFVYGSLSSKGAYLGARPEPPKTQAKAMPPKIGGNGIGEQAAARAYEAAERIDTIAAYQAVIRRFPMSIYAALSTERIRKHKRRSTETPAPAKPVPAEPADPAAAEAALGLAFKDRSLIQLGLSASGFDPGSVDGAFGPRTRAALKAWQAKAGKAVTGHLTLAAATALRAAGEKASRAAPRPGRTFRDCAVCPVMVVLRAGSFTMGSPLHEEGRRDDEGPQRRVIIRRPFAVGKYEVTFAEWDACVSAGGCNRRVHETRWGRGRQPVTNVSWADAKHYVGWLSRRTGKRYRLLSEAEWEYAARAGTRTRYHWGDDIGRNRANCDGSRSRWDDVQPAPVGSFAANRFGLHDMHGNVRWWVEDCWHENYRGAPSDGRAWTARGDCGQRVLRSGSYYYDPEFIRAAYRNQYPANSRDLIVGFRVARTLAP
ncbi:MAG: SUMF1/EgtB/PvdO family nonheme iron enzyme, partial [Rhodospirillaceae bacterium]|nr:SUMF1/EgtB/PvdO family nonheme iron enzyme [Rhodospirillaceae bacterium]